MQGQLKGQTPPLANQTDLDLINRGELNDKLSDLSGGLKWVPYSSNIPYTNVYAVQVGFTNIGDDEGLWRKVIAPIIVNPDYYDCYYDFEIAANSAWYYREGKGTFYLGRKFSSPYNYYEEVTISSQTDLDGTGYGGFTSAYIMYMLVKE